MWAVLVESYGNYGCIVPDGKSVQKLRNKTRRGWLSETTDLRRFTSGEVYVVEDDFVEKMRRMSPHQLAYFAMENYVERLK